MQISKLFSHKNTLTSQIYKMNPHTNRKQNAHKQTKNFKQPVPPILLLSKKKKEKKKHIMLEHAGAIKHSMGLSMPDWLFCFFVLRNGQKQSKNKKNYHYTILSKGKHWRGVHQEHYQEPHQEPHQEKAGGTMKTASIWQKWPRTYYMSISN